MSQQQQPTQTSSAASTSSQQTTSPTSLQHHFATLAPAPLAAHLADSAGHTILSTAESAQTAQVLLGLTHAYLAAHDTASRLGLGTPLRVTMTMRDGGVVVQTATETEGGEAIVGTVMAPGERMAEARMASQKVAEVGRRVGKVICEGRRGQ